MEKKIIGLVGQSQSTCTFIDHQIIQFLKQYVEVRTWCMDVEPMPPNKFEHCHLYIASNHSVYSIAKAYLPDDKKTIIARRTINTENLYKLLDIVSGEKVLVVTTTEETANNTIEILNGLGIRYIDFEPYWPRCNKIIPDDIKIAITTGLGHLVPQKLDIVDIGGKGIDISTFCDVLSSLDIPLSILNDISNYYLKAILRNNIHIRDSALQNEKLGQSMRTILDNVMEGIIAIDDQGKIKFFNPPAEEILGISGRLLLNRNIAEVLPGFDRDMLTKEQEEIKREIVCLNNKHYAIRNYLLDSQLMGMADMVIALFPADILQEMDQRVRSALKYKGNVSKYSFSDIVGQSSVIKKTVDLAKRFAATDLTVLIEGESGTGKELLAHSIHQYSPRKKGPFVAINFAGIPENLVESILFGYEEGAFTGAKRGGRPGLFEEAHMGTIMMDEMGSASLDIQNRLLRVLEEGEIRRVGASGVIPVNVRIIAATNIRLEELVNQGLFRKDLFYRVCAVPISIPPLRDRKDDIFLLVDSFANKINGRKLLVSNGLRDFLLNYDWPGNIRELHNFVMYLCNVVEEGAVAETSHLPSYVLEKTSRAILKGSGDAQAEVDAELREIVNQPDKAVIVSAILSILQSAQVFGSSVGRHGLQRQLKEKGIILSDYHMKHWLRVLAGLGYIETGVTRQGAKITEKGRKALKFLGGISSHWSLQ